MEFFDEHRIAPGSAVDLKTIDTRASGPFSGRHEAKQFTADTNRQIRKLQYRMYVENRQSLLIVLQAPDAAGKDGLIRKVLGRMNPQGCRTYPFKVPSKEELDHDFLWRIHRCTPGRGTVAVFNRSHYEDVLVVRVQKIVPEAVWRPRYELINDFEQNLIAAQTRILKFYLHISPREQLERFKQRLENPDKRWKLNVSDYAARTQWHAYRAAYEDVFRQCNSADAPWYVIPADNKWYRNAAVAGIVRQTLTDMNPQLPPADVDLDEMRALYEKEAAGLSD